MTHPLLSLGAVLMARFPAHDPAGHEQEGIRPALLVGLPANAGRGRHTLLLLAPLTSFKPEYDWVQVAPLLYPVLEAGVGGLPFRSVVLLDQTRGLDAQRLVRHPGNLTPKEYGPIRAALRLVFEC